MEGGPGGPLRAPPRIGCTGEARARRAISPTAPHRSGGPRGPPVKGTAAGGTEPRRPSSQATQIIEGGLDGPLRASPRIGCAGEARARRAISPAATHRWRRPRGPCWNETRHGDRSRVAPGLRPPTSSKGASTAPSEPLPGSVARAKPALEGRSVRRPPTDGAGLADFATVKHLIANAGLDRHDCGQQAVAQALRDAGDGVGYSGRK